MKEERPMPLPQEIFLRTKDKMPYQIVTTARHEKTDEIMVVYQALFGDYGVYVQGLSDFLADAEKKHSDVKADSTKADVDDVNSTDTSASASADNDDTGVSSDLIAFLDAKNYEEQRNVLIHMHPRITDRLIDDIAASIDVTVESGDLEQRYQSLLSCIRTKEKYEIIDR